MTNGITDKENDLSDLELEFLLCEINKAVSQLEDFRDQLLQNPPDELDDLEGELLELNRAIKYRLQGYLP